MTCRLEHVAVAAIHGGRVAGNEDIWCRWGSERSTTTRSQLTVLAGDVAGELGCDHPRSEDHRVCGTVSRSPRL
jgi:hypothetical protein